jgi:hypothetical protein
LDDENVIQIEGGGKQAAKLAEMKAKGAEIHHECTHVGGQCRISLSSWEGRKDLQSLLLSDFVEWVTLGPFQTRSKCCLALYKQVSMRPSTLADSAVQCLLYKFLINAIDPTMLQEASPGDLQAGHPLNKC